MAGGYPLWAICLGAGGPAGEGVRVEGSLVWLSEPGRAWVKGCGLHVGKGLHAREAAHTQELDRRSNVLRRSGARLLVGKVS